MTPEGDLRTISGRLAKGAVVVDQPRRGRQGVWQLAGVRVPLVTRSTAYVRLVGLSEFEMVYRYESINGQSIGSESGYATAPSTIPPLVVVTPSASPAGSVPTLR